MSWSCADVDDDGDVVDDDDVDVEDIDRAKNDDASAAIAPLPLAKSATASDKE